MVDINDGLVKKSELWLRLGKPPPPPLPAINELMGKLDFGGVPNKWFGEVINDSLDNSNPFDFILFGDRESGLSFSFVSIGSGLVLGVETTSFDATSILTVGEFGSVSNEPLVPSRSFRSRSDFLHFALRFYNVKVCLKVTKKIIKSNIIYLKPYLYSCFS